MPARWRSRTSASPMTASARPSRTCRSRCSPARPWRSSARRVRESRPRWVFCTAPSIRNPARSASTATTFASLTLSSLRRNIGVVFQEPMLFARSIRENLQVGRPEATDAEMIEALERAQAIEFISRQPDGLDTIVGERGRSLSGGERQRLSIARALLEGPADPDPRRGHLALDAATEAKLQLGARRGDEGSHDLRDRAPARDDPQRRPHPGVRSGPGRSKPAVSTISSSRAAGSPRWPRRSSWPGPTSPPSRPPKAEAAAHRRLDQTSSGAFA